MTMLSHREWNRVARCIKVGLYSSTICMCFAFAPANAQTTTNQRQSAEASDAGEILVTARKVAESAQKVPVVVTAVSAEKLQLLQITQMGDLPTIVPGLTIGHFQAIGAQISMRGVGATAFSNNVDQSVSLNIDGVQIGTGQAYKQGLFDLGQIEVLKGPQSLFYGKSTTGGVISLQTANPTDTPELMGQVGYEAEAKAWNFDGVISGPVTDTVKMRLAAHYEKSEGYFKTGTTAVLPGTGAVLPAHDRAPYSHEVMVRGTTIWEPTSNFTARLKASYGQTLAIHNLAAQFTGCEGATGGVPPTNRPYIGGENTCKLGRETFVVGYNPAAFPGALTVGVPIPRTDPFSATKLGIASLNLSYQPVENISLDSTTGYYKIKNEDWVSAYNNTYAGAATNAQALFRRVGLTEEVRATSSFDGPLNFVLGAFYEDGWLSNRSLILSNALYGLTPVNLYNIIKISTKTYSGFGQIKYKIIPEIELAAGVRYSDETRTQHAINLLNNTVYPSPIYTINSKKWMPDFTITYIPDDNLTLYAAYRKGFKSGGFGSASVNVDNSFGDESSKGGEAGIKSRLFDRQLLFNVAAYRYTFSGLQVGVVQPPVNGFVISRVVNAGSAKTYGVDLETAFRPHAVEGLQLNLALNWNRARFSTLNNVPCWTGQTISQGCNQNFNPVTNLYTAQTLSGTALPRAPEWQTTVGGSYEIKTASDFSVVLSSSTTYSSKYRTQLAAGLPNDGVYQKGFAKFDLGVTVKAPDDRWEVALIGKNIGDKVIAGSCTVQASRSGGAFGGFITGAANPSATGQGQVVCFPQPGRELWLRLTWRPFSGK